MADIRKVPEVKLVCGLIAGSEEWRRRGVEALVAAYGPTDLESAVLPFDCTDYYEAEMGPGLLRQFVSFTRLIDPASLADVKLHTNAMEKQWTAPGPGLRRRVNLDPGYITPAKLVLATTKDFAHRIYLHSGIYAEVTLNFTKTGFRHFDWTYPDFKSGRYDAFLSAVRRQLMAVPVGG